MSRALRRGWAVVATDFTGPKHAFAAGALAGRLVLDGIRAALGFEATGFDDATPIGLWGYSGGAQATLFAAEQQPSYAPELNIAGAAAGGIPGDVLDAVRVFEHGSLLSGVWFGAMIGMSRELDIDLSGVLTPEGHALAASAADMSVQQLLMSFPFLRLGDYLTVASVADIPGLRTAHNGLGEHAPVTPLYLYHSTHDQNLATADVERLVENYRRGGTDVTYRPLRFTEHVIAAPAGMPGALRFLGERLRTALWGS